MRGMRAAFERRRLALAVAGQLSTFMVRSVYAVHVPWIAAHHSETIGGVPNLSRSRQHRLLVSLGNAIREARISKGISQEKLALLAEVDRSYVGRVERGDNNVAILTLARISDALGLSLAKLMQKAEL